MQCNSALAEYLDSVQHNTFVLNLVISSCLPRETADKALSSLTWLRISRSHSTHCAWAS